MADPVKYVVGYDFAGYQAVNPADPLPGNEVDSELADVATSISGLVDAVKDVRRSDGALKNGVVTYDALSDSVKGILGADVIASTATSTSSVLIGTGTKTFTVESGKVFSVGMPVTVADAGAPTVNLMAGVVVSYSGTTLVVNVTGFTGSGTISSWIINISGLQGPAGSPGPAGSGTGDMLKTENLSGLSDYATARGNLGLGSLAVLSAVPDLSITNAKLASDAVTTVKILNDAVTTGKIAPDNIIGTYHIQPGTVSNAELADMAANTVKVRAANSSGVPGDVALSASNLIGRGATGDIAAISLGNGLSMVGTALTADTFGAWTSYTPTVQGQTNGLAFTNISAAGYYRVEGKSLRGRLKLAVSGAPGTGTGYMVISLPGGFTIDTTTLVDAALYGNVVGAAFVYDASATATYTGACGYSNSAQRLVVLTHSATTPASATVPVTLASGDIITLEFDIPVT